MFSQKLFLKVLQNLQKNICQLLLLDKLSGWKPETCQKQPCCAKQSVRKNLSKNASSFLKIFFSFRCFSLNFATAKQLSDFSISRPGNLEDFFNVNIFFDCKYKCDFTCKYIDIVCYLKLHFYFLACSRMPNSNSANCTTSNNHQIF